MRIENYAQFRLRRISRRPRSILKLLRFLRIFDDAIAGQIGFIVVSIMASNAARLGRFYKNAEPCLRGSEVY